MTIQKFIKIEEGKKYEDALKGCDKHWEIEHWTSIEDYVQCLTENGWDDEEIEEQAKYIRDTCYKVNQRDRDFVIVCN